MECLRINLRELLRVLALNLAKSFVWHCGKDGIFLCFAITKRRTGDVPRRESQYDQREQEVLRKADAVLIIENDAVYECQGQVHCNECNEKKTDKFRLFFLKFA